MRSTVEHTTSIVWSRCAIQIALNLKKYVSKAASSDNNTQGTNFSDLFSNAFVERRVVKRYTLSIPLICTR